MSVDRPPKTRDCPKAQLDRAERPVEVEMVVVLELKRLELLVFLEPDLGERGFGSVQLISADQQIHVGHRTVERIRIAAESQSIPFEQHRDDGIARERFETLEQKLLD